MTHGALTCAPWGAMVCPMTQAAQTYAEWLGSKMKERDFTQRSLGRALNPSNPEIGRRAVRRYLGGMVPLERTRTVIAEALGVDETGPAPSDDEGLDLFADLRRQLADTMAMVSRLETQAAAIDRAHAREMERAAEQRRRVA